jgi:hypothetical protein
MPGSIRTLTAAAAAGAAALLSVTASQPALAAHSTGPQTLAQAAAPAAGAGLAGKPIVLANNEEFSGYDAASSESGTAYIGWIGDVGGGRKVFLCALPRGSSRCAGGVQSVDSLGDSSAQGLRVLLSPGGQVTLVWFHDTVASENGPQGSEIAVATAAPSGHLSAGHDVATAPSFGLMQDAVSGPGGTIWVVAGGAGRRAQAADQAGFRQSRRHDRHALLRRRGQARVQRDHGRARDRQGWRHL